MYKKYIVRLTEDERDVCRQTIKKLKGTSQKVRRAHILLKADADGPAWTDLQIAEAFSCRTRTVQGIRERFVVDGFEAALERKQRQKPPRENRLNGKQEAELIAMRLGPPPEGYSTWSLRLLACKAVELELVDSLSHETVRRTLKKTE